MRPSKRSVAASLLCVVAVGFLVFFPRYFSLLPASANFMQRVFHDVMYLSGTLELVGNFALFIPIFVVLSYLFRALNLFLVACISSLISGMVETVQIWIPGRVSSGYDFLCNTVGIFVAYSIIRFVPGLEKRIR